MHISSHSARLATVEVHDSVTNLKWGMQCYSGNHFANMPKHLAIDFFLIWKLPASFVSQNISFSSPHSLNRSPFTILNIWGSFRWPSPPHAQPWPSPWNNTGSHLIEFKSMATFSLLGLLSRRQPSASSAGGVYIQFNPIQFNPVQFNSIPFNSIQFNSIQFN